MNFGGHFCVRIFFYNSLIEIFNKIHLHIDFQATMRTLTSNYAENGTLIDLVAHNIEIWGLHYT